MERLLAMKSVQAMFDCSHTHIYDLLGQGIFPKPVKLGRDVRWKYSELEQFINEKWEAV